MKREEKMNISEGCLNDWILDFVCCFRMCVNNDLFDSYKSCKEGDVVMINGSMSKIIKKDTIKMKIYDGAIKTIGDVRFVPGLRI